MSLLAEMAQKALDLGVPINAHLDLTYRCNERCEHCYLSHDDKGEMTTAEITGILDQLAEAGVFYLALSGGEPMLRGDFWEILEHARRRRFLVKVKSNALLIREREARRLRALAVHRVQISIYSHRPEVHDGITRVKGSLARSLAAIRFLKEQGVPVSMANVLMRQNLNDYAGVQALAEELGVPLTTDPTITPHLDGERALLPMRIRAAELHQVFQDPNMVGNVDEFCAPPQGAGEEILDSYSCSAGHTSVYISPYGDVYPCVQFPLPCGNLRRQPFREIWEGSAELGEVRSIKVRDLPTCSSCGHTASCTRCPGLAYMEGDMRGPSAADCEKSFARTGVYTANMVRRMPASALVQIQSAAGQD